MNRLAAQQGAPLMRSHAPTPVAFRCGCDAQHQLRARGQQLQARALAPAAPSAPASVSAVERAAPALNAEEEHYSEQDFVSDYQYTLRLYRGLKQQVGAWQASFQVEHRRQPTAADAAATGGAAFGSLYGTFLELRKRLLVELPRLRERLQAAAAAAEERAHDSAAAHHERGARRGSIGGVNANVAAPPPGGHASHAGAGAGGGGGGSHPAQVVDNVATWLRADRYRRQRAMAAAAVSGGGGVGGAWPPQGEAVAAAAAAAAADAETAAASGQGSSTLAAAAAAAAPSATVPAPRTAAAASSSSTSGGGAHARPGPGPPERLAATSPPQHSSPEPQSAQAPLAAHSQQQAAPAGAQAGHVGLWGGAPVQAPVPPSGGPLRASRLEGDVALTGDGRAKNALLAALQYKRTGAPSGGGGGGGGGSQAAAAAAGTAAGTAGGEACAVRPGEAGQPTGGAAAAAGAPLVQRGDTVGAYAGRVRRTDALPEAFMLCP